MRFALTLAAIAASTLMTGCVATMGDLAKNADSFGKTITAAVTPSEVQAYQAFAARNSETILATLEAMKASQLPPPVATVSKVQFRDAVGRVFEAEAIQAFRFPVPQDALDAEAAELKPMLQVLGSRMAEWNATEPIELVAVADSTSEADFLAAQIKRTAPALKVSTKVGSASSVGYSGVELVMVNKSLQRTLK